MIVRLPRVVAAARGLHYFYTGKACKHGHVAARLTSNGACAPCGSVYSMKWYRENTEAARATMKKSAAKCADARRRYFQEWLTPERRQKCREQVRKWQQENPERAKANRKAAVLRRRAAKKRRTPTWYGEFDDFVMREAFDLSLRRNACTTVRWDIDHMIPMLARTASGLHCGVNIQVIPRPLNKQKGNKLLLTEPGEWVRHI